MTFIEAAKKVANGRQKDTVMFLVDTKHFGLYKGQIGESETLFHALRREDNSWLFTKTVYQPNLYNIVYGDWEVDENTKEV